LSRNDLCLLKKGVLAKQGSDGRSGVLLQGGNGMGVDVKSDGYGGVTEPAL
jgi:hypothetical protein